MSTVAGAGGRLRKRRTRQQALVSHERWLVSYADFMTLLFAFFVVLFAASRHSSDALGKLSGAIHSGFSGKEAGAPASTQRPPGPATPSSATHGGLGIQPNSLASTELSMQDMALLEGQLRSVLGSSIQKHEVSLQQTSDGLVISFQELGFFHSAEANLLPGQADKIEQAGDILKQHKLMLRVEGHSDDQPIHNDFFASNWELSAARAMTVLLLLVDQTHYDPTRISVAGYGPYRPVADNTTPAGRQKNRRVDLVVIRERGIQDRSLAPETPR